MGFYRLTYAIYGGSKVEEINGGNGTVIEQTCSNCNGEGSIVSHTGAVGSVMISIDPATKEGDVSWASLWRRHDDGIIELLDSSAVPTAVSQ